MYVCIYIYFFSNNSIIDEIFKKKYIYILLLRDSVSIIPKCLPAGDIAVHAGEYFDRANCCSFSIYTGVRRIIKHRLIRINISFLDIISDDKMENIECNFINEIFLTKKKKKKITSTTKRVVLLQDDASILPVIYNIKRTKKAKWRRHNLHLKLIVM